MNIYEAELREKWNAIDYPVGGSLQLAIDHPLEWHVRYATLHQKSVVIVCTAFVGEIESSKSIEACCNQRKDGRYAITFTLLDQNQEDVFITMTGDIIQFSQAEAQEKASLVKVLQRYSAWKKLLDHRRGDLMGESSQKGLIGELFFLKKEIEGGREISEAVSGWGGPDGADQDFVYKDSWYEIKTAGASTSAVTISSLEQLDSETDGELVVYRVDKCVPTQTRSFTLYQIVHTIYDLLAKNDEALSSFRLKLAFAGYNDEPEYDKQNYVLSSEQVYRIDSTFPRLTRSNVPVEIINTKYQLSLSGLENWLK